jgi:hypothetical protein
VALAAAGPAISALADEWSAAMSDSSNLPALWPVWVAMDVTAQAVVGVLFLYVGAAILTWSGGLLGGVASGVEMRAAMAWSQVPGIAAAIVLVIAVLMGVPVPQLMGSTLPHIDPAFYKVLLIELVLGLWGGIIGMYCIAEVHRFSTWRAFCATLIPAVVAMVVLGFAVFVFYELDAHSL